MSTTATEKSSGRTRVEQLERSERKLRAREAELVALIEASPQVEADARREHLRRSPLTLPGATSPAVKERKRREQAERDLESVRANLATVTELLAEARVEERAVMLRRLEREADAARETQRQAWRDLGEKFASLVDSYAVYRDAVQEWDSRREAAAAEAGITGDAATEWRNGEGRHAVLPVYCDLGAVLDALVATTCDPLLMGYRESSAYPYDETNELTKLVPDLRDKAPPLDVAREPKKFSTRQAAHI